MREHLERNRESEKLAGRTYEEAYNREDELSSGLAVTHEQVSDSYMAGETFQEPKNKKPNNR